MTKKWREKKKIRERVVKGSDREEREGKEIEMKGKKRIRTSSALLFMSIL